MPIKILIRRDSTENFVTEAFIPREQELVTAYETGSNKIIYKLGDGKTQWTNLPEVTTIEEIDHFKVYYREGKEAIEMFLNPFSIQKYLKENRENGECQNGTEDSNTQMRRRHGSRRIY